MASKDGQQRASNLANIMIPPGLIAFHQVPLSQSRQHHQVSFQPSKMHASTCFVVLATVFSTAFAKTITIENKHWGGDTKIQIGNKNCGQDTYIFKNNRCDGNAQVHLGDIVPKGCKPPSHQYIKNVSAGKCRIHMGHQFL
ncbi:hypothetical protein B0H63DRAFT_528820 [Podospora didyma]|uniref:Uncharacterized protein n=1 Tax=Podospora didyma TaxID=330526 RepID=A0AAE0K1R0_9PEZI|nr:hypothetical protein B0H63DRAFT_528820 [Podospora didyma]